MDFNKEGLTRQGSVYNLTFDEFQSSMGGLGKDFGSMNMDELLKNIWTAEESQAMAAANPAPPPGGGGIQRQGSVSLPRTLSQKTVDEVWRDLVRENTNTGNNGVERVSVVERNVISNNGNNNGNNNNPGRQQTLGEMTLEEFLVRAGVDINLSNQLNNNNNNNNNINNTTNNNINPSNNMNNTINTNNNASSSDTSLFFSNNTLPVMPMPIPIQAYSTHQVMTLPTNGMMPCVNATTKNNNNNINNNGNNGEMSSSLSPVGYTFGGGGKKGGGPVEKVVERRQRRMIKNRESAARSRARKQAYTIELEAEVAKLKEQNEELQKKQQEIMEMQKNQSMEKINPQQSGPKKRCLRRTQTGPW